MAGIEPDTRPDPERGPDPLESAGHVVPAPNASPMTLDGTRTFVVGSRLAVVIDPGPDHAGHLDAIVRALDGAEVAAILLTHRHPDHAAGADALARRLRAPVCAGFGGLDDGDSVATDRGEIVAIHTPGHTPDHFAFHWPRGRALFCGDLMMGGLDTALVAGPDGDLARYMDSLDRVRALDLDIIYPAHGDPFHDPAPALERYVRHRMERLDQVRAALAHGPDRPERIVDRVYGDTLDPALRRPALGAIRTYLQHLADAGEAARDDDDGGERWRRTGTDDRRP